jgi:hypothetical protein
MARSELYFHQSKSHQRGGGAPEIVHDPELK